MSSSAAARCRHIKVNGTQCGSPALRNKDLCFYHQQDRPIIVECYSDGEYATGEIELAVFEDAQSIQSVIRQIVQMLLQKRIQQKTASLVLYALQIASSNLKRVEHEKPQPEQLVSDVETVSWRPMAASQQPAETTFAAQPDRQLESANPSIQQEENSKQNNNNDEAARTQARTAGRTNDEEDLPEGTIQACYRPKSLPRKHRSKPTLSQSNGRIKNSNTIVSATTT